MIERAISRCGTTLVRRLVLEPHEATPWHIDPFHRLAEVERGEALAIEYRDTGETERVAVAAGQADWEALTDRVHRAVNVGGATYEEVTIFFLDRPDTVAQPIAE